MHSSLLILFGAATLGFVGGAIPGPVLTTIFAEIAETGFLRSLRVLFFAMLVETCIRLFALVSVARLPVDGVAFQSLSLVGAAILLRIAYKVWHMHAVGEKGHATIGLKTLALMIVCNGMLWTYWLTVCVPDAMQLGQQLPYGQFLFLLVFELGWGVSTFLMACVFALFKQVLSHPKVMPVLFKLFSLVFVLFAVKTIIRSLEFFFHR